MREKVLYLSGFSPYSTCGGGNQRCNCLLRALSNRYDVDVIVDFDDIVSGQIPDTMAQPYSQGGGKNT